MDIKQHNLSLASYCLYLSFVVLYFYPRLLLCIVCS
jgi:hypothetical protein